MWRLSTELMAAVSQILQQKAAWQVKPAGSSYYRHGAFVRERAVDPRCILVIGDDAQFSGSDQEQDVKSRTFELFRRDSRNIDLLTYSELYERAAFIVGEQKKNSRRKVGF